MHCAKRSFCASSRVVRAPFRAPRSTCAAPLITAPSRRFATSPLFEAQSIRAPTRATSTTDCSAGGRARARLSRSLRASSEEGDPPSPSAPAETAEATTSPPQTPSTYRAIAAGATSPPGPALANAERKPARTSLRLGLLPSEAGPVRANRMLSAAEERAASEVAPIYWPAAMDSATKHWISTPSWDALSQEADPQLEGSLQALASSAEMAAPAVTGSGASRRHCLTPTERISNFSRSQLELLPESNFNRDWAQIRARAAAFKGRAAAWSQHALTASTEPLPPRDTIPIANAVPGPEAWVDTDPAATAAAARTASGSTGHASARAVAATTSAFAHSGSHRLSAPPALVTTANTRTASKS